MSPFSCVMVERSARSLSAAPATTIKSAPVRAGESPAAGRKGKDLAALASVKELPTGWWKTAENDLGGYQMQGEFAVFQGHAWAPLPTLLDTCAGTNSITEEKVLKMLKDAWKAGLKPSDPRFPVVQFEKWSRRDRHVLHVESAFDM